MPRPPFYGFVRGLCPLFGSQLLLWWYSWCTVFRYLPWKFSNSWKINALTQDKGNICRSRKAFFYAPNADPVLVKVKYNITFAENITEDVLPNCTEFNNPESVVPIALNQIWIIHGWTSTGLYLWIEPLVLNLIQVKFPFFILRVIRLLNRQSWNGDISVGWLLWSLFCPGSSIFVSLPCHVFHLRSSLIPQLKI